MTVVVADTSPLNYLTLIGLIDVLPRLYGRVVIRQEVLSELTDPDTPRQVLEWARHLPDWSDVRQVPAADARRCPTSTQGNGARSWLRSPRLWRFC